jgi:uncharacterized protein (DUF2384 family)
MARAQLERKLAGDAVAWAEQELELSDPEIGQALGVDRKTVYRWRQRESAPRPEQRKRMEKLLQFRWLLEHSFRTPSIGKQWLHRPITALRGRTPFSALADGDLDTVIGLLATLSAGAHV